MLVEGFGLWRNDVTAVDGFIFGALTSRQ